MSYENLKVLLQQMVEAKTKGERGALLTQAMALVERLEQVKPAPEDAMVAEYEAGALKAMELLQQVRCGEEASFQPARSSSAGIVLNGLENYGQAMCSRAESALSIHLRERWQSRKSGRSE